MGSRCVVVGGSVAGLLDRPGSGAVALAGFIRGCVVVGKITINFVGVIEIINTGYITLGYFVPVISYRGLRGGCLNI